MGIRKSRRPEMNAGEQHILQSLTPSGAAATTTITTRVKQNGVTVITSTGTGGASHIYRIEQPRRAGIQKIMSVQQKTTQDVKIQSHSSAASLDGSTANTVTFTTGAAVRTLTIISVSTAAWRLLHKTTGMTFSKAATIA